MTLRDDPARTRARSETGSSFLVEASAGTGKTTTLISRILTLVLERKVQLRRIAAMTFTEKAAGEMKTKLRQELEKEAAAGLGAAVRARQAILELESAEVSTIHSFCARLLRERPVEAGVDPDFVAGDELLAADLAEEAFETWFDRTARIAGSPVAAALLAGAEPEGIHKLAVGLYENRLVLDRTTLPTDARDEAIERLDRSIEAVEQVDGALSSSKKRTEQVALVRQYAAGLRNVRRALSEGAPPASLPEGIKLSNAWPAEARELIKEARLLVEPLEELLRALPFVPTLTALVEEIRTSFFRTVEEAKSERGILDFDDLLLRARDLLKKSPAARRHFHARFDTLVVDEFQDTDPVQAEIVMRLAAPTDGQGEDWTSLKPEPGRLFLVGDPKQSIYRFRRADVEAYREAAKQIAVKLPLETNFRSSVPLIEFVNAVGSTLLPKPEPGSPWMVPYVDLFPGPKAAATPSPGVLYLAPTPPEPSTKRASVPDGGDDTEDEEQIKVNEKEARAVANLLLARFSAGERPWGRIAVLVPRHSAIELLQEAFREAGIPFLLEGGKSFYRREETAAVVAALSAIDDPGDAVSVVAAFKSLLFGLSDLELLEAAEAGVRFENLSSVPEGSPLRPAADLIRRLHEARHKRPVAETLADLLRATQAFASAENGAVVNPVQAAANLERLLVLARDLDRERLSFREAVGRLRRRTEKDGPEPAARVEEADAVRLMTLHKAKGLEFPVVVLADFGFKERKRRGEKAAVVCEKAGGRYGVRLRFGGTDVGTARLTEVVEQDEERQEAENRRLLYVGMTRAKERLVVSWFRKRTLKKDGEVSDSIGKSFLAPLARFEEAPRKIGSLVEVVQPDLSAPGPLADAPEAGGAVDLAAAMAEADARLEKVRVTASRRLRRAGEKDTPLPVAHEDAEPADRDDAPDRARRIGIAVHAAMEALLERSSPPDAAATREEIRKACESLFEDERREVAPLVEELLSSPVVSRAFAARRRFVELPLLFLDETSPAPVLVEGKIDLLFEETDGWQIVDWKTDHAPTAAERRGREEVYRPQLAAYEEGLGKLLGPGAVVKRGLLVFARALRE
ncbi:MAG: UvrD-helicase domain-containing protein [Acidithiobacillales bacterium]